MRRSEEFARAVRNGRRAGSRLIVVHVLDRPDGADTDADPARIGFVVGRGVGGSVVRSQVSRRLRHVLRDRLELLPDGTLVVVRALAPAATASSAVLAGEVDRALGRLSLSGRAA